MRAPEDHLRPSPAGRRPRSSPSGVAPTAFGAADLLRTPAGSTSAWLRVQGYAAPVSGRWVRGPTRFHRNFPGTSVELPSEALRRSAGEGRGERGGAPRCPAAERPSKPGRLQSALGLTPSVCPDSQFSLQPVSYRVKLDFLEVIFLSSSKVKTRQIAGA